MFGAGAAFFTDYLDDTIKDEEEAKRALAWPLLAMIPAIEGTAEGSGPADLVVQQNPQSSPAEAFRGLRTAIHFSSLKRDCKVLMITSSFPGEGKSTIAANLALTLAQTGNRVLLVDCDLRRRTSTRSSTDPGTPASPRCWQGMCPWPRRFTRPPSTTSPC